MLAKCAAVMKPRLITPKGMQFSPQRFIAIYGLKPFMPASLIQCFEFSDENEIAKVPRGSTHAATC